MYSIQIEKDSTSLSLGDTTGSRIGNNAHSKQSLGGLREAKNGIIRLRTLQQAIFALLAIMLHAPLVAQDYNFGGGDGSTATPFQITSTRQLDSIRNYTDDGGTNYLTAHFVLMNDLDFADYNYADGTKAEGGEGWEPIGNHFTGTFNGNHHVIRNLYIHRPDNDQIGLFGRGGRIDSLALVGAEITGRDHVGAMMGRGGTIEYSYISECQITGRNYVGGLMGQGGTIKYSHAQESQVTGIGGDGYQDNGTGGLMGRGGTIEYSYASVLITGGNGSAGGLMGIAGNVRYSHSSGQVTAQNGGGLVGLLYNNVENCYSTALVIGDGGLVDVSDGGTIRTSYACGRVEGGGKGLISFNGGDITDSYWNTETSGKTNGGGGTGLTTAQMYDIDDDDGDSKDYEDYFDGFDFTTIWLPPTEDVHFPQLRDIDKNAQLLIFNSVDTKGTSDVGASFSLTISSMLPPTIMADGAVIDTVFESSNTEVATVDNDGNVTIESVGGSVLTVRRDGNSDYAPVSHIRPLVVTSFSEGTGTTANPYQVTSWEQMAFIRDHGLGANFLDDHYVLTTDLDFEDYASDDKGWKPIGQLVAKEFDVIGTRFTGTFNGQGHVIANLKINRPNEDYVGLFGAVGGQGKIDSLGLENVQITGLDIVGGMAGHNAENSIIKNSYAQGSVEGGVEVGGLVGRNINSRIENSYASGRVVGTGVDRIEDEGNAGGLVGENAGSSRIINCYATGQVEGLRGVGGLAGDNSATINKSYAVGRVLGNENVGGLVGNNDGTINNSYWNTDASELTTGGDTGLTTAEMYDEDDDDGDGETYVDYFDGFGFYNATTAPSEVWSPPTEDMHFPQLRTVSKNAQVLVLPLLAPTNAIGGTVSVAPTLLLPPTLSDGTAINTTYASSDPTVASVAEDGNGDVSIKAIGLTSLTVSRAGNADYTSISSSSPLLVHPFPAGEGTEEAPFQVETTAQLDAIRNYGGGANLLDRHYALMANLDFKDYNYTNTDAGWQPIGHHTGGVLVNFLDYTGTPFTGVFNGKGHAIANLRANRGNGFVGLFGLLAGQGKIDSLGLEDVTITSGRGLFVGGMAGAMTDASTITNSYASGRVSGSELIGGLVGYHTGDSIGGSYAACQIKGDGGVGGLVSINEGIIAESYATGWVTGDNHRRHKIGGLVGENHSGGEVTHSYATSQVGGTADIKKGLIGENNGNVTESYWNTELSRRNTSDGGSGLTTAQMYDVDDDDGDGENYIQHFNGFDFTNIWLPPTEDTHFPQLRGVSKNAQILIFNPLASVGTESTFTLEGGDEEGDDYFLLPPTLTEQDGVTEVPVQLESSNLNVVTVGANNEATAVGAGTTTLTLRRASNEDYIPVSFSRDLLVHPFSAGTGTAEDPFLVSTPTHLDFIRGGQEIDFLSSHYEMTADLDFSNYEYSNAAGWQPITTFNGVFNGKGFVVSNLRANSGDANNIGVFGIIGTSGRIDSLGVEDVSFFGRDFVGGMAGRNRGIISHSYVDGRIQGNNNIGGMAGANDSTIQYSYASAQVRGNENVGGFSGANSDTIRYSYAYGAVTGNTMEGGLVGMNDAGVYISNYYNTETSGETLGIGNVSSDPAGVTSLTNNEMYTTGFADFDFTAETGAWLPPMQDVHFPLLRGLNGQQWVTLSTADNTSINEGGSVDFTVERAGRLTDDLVVNISFAETSEFVSASTPRSVTFAGQATMATFTVTTDDDDMDEDDASVTVSLKDSLGYQVGSSSAPGARVAIAVTDDDLSEITIASDGNITEGEDAVFTLTRTGSSSTLSVNVSVTEQGNYISGMAPTMVDFVDGLTEVKLTIPTDDDQVDEPGGTITATVTPSQDDYTVGDPSSATIAVADDDGKDDPDVSITSAGDITEGEDAVFTLTRTTTSGELDVTVSVTETGSYINGAAPAMVSFADGEDMATLTIPTENDDLDEEDGSITATLTSGIGYSVVTPSSATVAVSDNDLPKVSIASAGDINEGADAVFTLTRTTTSGELMVNVSVTEQGSSYISGAAPTMVAFVDGEATATLTVSTEDDAIDEPGGLITATVTSGTGYEAGDPASAVVAVADDDGEDDPDVTITSAGDVTEGADAVFTLSRTTTSLALTVNVSVTEQGNYISGTAPTMVSFASGESTATLTIPTEDDDMKEEDGSITATVTSGVGYTIGDPSSATVAAADNDDEMMVADPEVSIASAGDVTEGADAVFTLTRSSASSALTVNVSVTEQGSYISGTAPTMVDFAANATTATLTINTDDDDVDESDGSITATVSSGTGYEIGDPSSATAAVADNDDPEPVGLSDDSEVVLYPNPVERYLHVRLPAGGSVSLYTLSGRLEETHRIQAGREQVSLDVSGLSSGIYVVTLSDLGGQTTHYRIVKE